MDKWDKFCWNRSRAKEVYEIDSKEKIEQYATKNSIKWHFNHPSASHIGRVRENMIRCTRRAMMGILPREV